MVRSIMGRPLRLAMNLATLAAIALGVALLLVAIAAAAVDVESPAEFFELARLFVPVMAPLVFGSLLLLELVVKISGPPPAPRAPR